MVLAIIGDGAAGSISYRHPEKKIWWNIVLHGGATVFVAEVGRVSGPLELIERR